MRILTRKAVVEALGEINDLTVADIVATGATPEELAEACAWTTNADGNRRRTFTRLDLVPSNSLGDRIWNFQGTRSASSVTLPVSLKLIVHQSLELTSSGVTVRRRFTATCRDSLCRASRKRE